MQIPELTDDQKELLWKFWMPVGLAVITILGILIAEYKDGFGVEVETENIDGRPAYCASDATLDQLKLKLVLSDTFFGETANLSQPIDSGSGYVCYLGQ